MTITHIIVTYYKHNSFERIHLDSLLLLHFKLLDDYSFSGHIKSFCQLFSPLHPNSILYSYKESIISAFLAFSIHYRFLKIPYFSHSSPLNLSNNIQLSQKLVFFWTFLEVIIYNTLISFILAKSGEAISPIIELVLLIFTL